MVQFGLVWSSQCKKGPVHFPLPNFSPLKLSPAKIPLPPACIAKHIIVSVIYLSKWAPTEFQRLQQHIFLFVCTSRRDERGHEYSPRTLGRQTSVPIIHTASNMIHATATSAFILQGQLPPHSPFFKSCLNSRNQTHSAGRVCQRVGAAF